MAQYLCQICYKTVTYGENHPCFIYKNDDNVYPLPRLDEMDKNNDDNTARLMEGSAKLCSNVQQKENIEQNCIYKREFRGVYERTSFVSKSNYEQKQSVSKLSNSFHAKAFDGYEKSSKERKLESLNKDKVHFLHALELATKNASSANKNISGTSNSFIDSDILPLNEEPANDLIGPLGNHRGGNISPGVPPQVHKNDEEIDINETELVRSMKEDNSAVGHSRKRASSKIYACDFCPRKFKHKSHFNNHHRIHTGEKPFVCDKCGKEFTQKATFNNHHRTHTGEKPFVCGVCKRSFAHSGSLKANMLYHTWERPFKCPVCRKAFKSKTNCNMLQKRVHKSIITL